jgi:hypothetical protein
VQAEDFLMTDETISVTVSKVKINKHFSHPFSPVSPSVVVILAHDCRPFFPISRDYGSSLS